MAGDIPSTEVASTPTTYAFRDISPQAPTHVLVVPRRHIADAHNLTAEHGPLLADLFATAQQVAFREGCVTSDSPSEDMDTGGYRLVLNIGPDATNTVAHLHLHVLGGRQMSWPPG